MSSNDVPFYARAAVLDRYIHSPDPASDPESLEVILEMLKSQEDRELRDYFFRSGPSAAWAPILWDHTFFESPPPPEETVTGLALPRWDVQEYLVSVASQVPDVVTKHIEALHGHGWYISRAIRALCLASAEAAERVTPRITEWLKDPTIASAIASETYDLIVKLAQEGRSAPALSLFRELTAPVPATDAKIISGLPMGAEAVCKFKGTWDEDQILQGGILSLKSLDIRQVVTFLENHFRTALRMEAAAMSSPDFEFSSWWRTAIEETGQDQDLAYRDRLLAALRDTLEAWVKEDAPAVEPLVQRYLGEDHQILRRMGFHMLHRFTTRYRTQVISQLRRSENLHDVGIHHEYFMLLQQGYPLLGTEDREALVATICRGPSSERVRTLAEWARKQHGANAEEYAEHYSRRWIRDRLWMIRSHLTGEAERILHELTSDLGEPEHPAFTRWSSGPHWVKEVSPITDQEIADMGPDDLVAFLKQWQPEPDRGFGPERVSTRGLANTVASVVVADSMKYAEQLLPVALQRPEFAASLLQVFHENERAKDVPWRLMIDLCRGLVADDMVRQDMSFSLDGSWIDVRRSIIRLLELGLRNPERALPAEYLPEVRGILLILLSDPDPAEEPSPEEWAELRDPATGALNYVRPSALRVLVHYAALRARLKAEHAGASEPEGPGPKRLEPDVEKALTRTLDRSEDPSWAVHSVYGHHLPLLYWLDEEWVESHIDQILPQSGGEQSTWLFVTAWESFITSNRFCPSMLELLRPSYERAIHNLHTGYTTHSHLMPARGLAVHLTWEYVQSGYDLASSEDEHGLIVGFFRMAPPEMRGGPAWWLWRIGEDNPSQFEGCWPSVRALWEWRVHEASAAGHSTDFDEEMKWFARLPLVAPRQETIASLWPLLEGMVPHITRSGYPSMGWASVEKYLSGEVERDPVRAIQLYRVMHDQLAKPRRYYPDEARTILETGAARDESRPEALHLIDTIFRWGGTHFLDILERHAG